MLGTGKVLTEAAARVPVGLLCMLGVTGTPEAEVAGTTLAMTFGPATTPALTDVPETAPTSFAPAVSITGGRGPGAKAAADAFKFPEYTEVSVSVLALYLAGNAETAVLFCAESMSVKSAVSSCSSSVSAEVSLASAWDVVWCSPSTW